VSDNRQISIKPRFPLFWQAIYPEHLRELRIPICRRCGNLIKVSSYDDVVCPNTVAHMPTGDEVMASGMDLADSQIAILIETKTTYGPCESTDISFDVDDGALVIPLQYGVLNEFDEDGNEPINFRHLPTAGLQAFGLIDPILRPPTMYMINLNTGTLEFGNVNTGMAIPVGVGIEFPTVNGINVVPISMVLQRYGDGGDLIHYQHGNHSGMASVDVLGGEATMGGFEMDPSSMEITNIVVGYKCRIPGWTCQVKINVDCATHIPFVTTKATRVEG
jgi:hypothetical protein